MVRVTEALCVADGEVPVTVRVYVPGAAVPALTLRVAPPPAVTEPGLIEAVAPAGAPPTARVTVSAEPLTTAVEMALLPFPPAASERAAGFAEMEKSFDACAPQPGNLNDPIRV